MSAPSMNRRRPKRSPRRPAIGCSEAIAMRYDVTSHARVTRSAPRSRPMSGSATTIIVEFRGTSRLPSATARTNAGMRLTRGAPREPAERGGRERAGEGADARGREHPRELDRADLQEVVRDGGEQLDVRAREERGRRREDEDPTHDDVLAHVREPLADRVEHRDLAPSARDGHRMHPQERDDDREVRDRVDVEEEAGAERRRIRERREDEAADDRSDDLWTVEGGGVEADRAHEIALGNEAR